MPPGLPSFDLVLATLGRVAELDRLLDSLDAQTYRGFRLIVVDQNADDRLSAMLEARQPDVLRLTAPPGLAGARNIALGSLTADVVAFPDDDCVYPPLLLERVARRFADDATLDGLSVRTADDEGQSDAGWMHDPTRLEKRNVWNLVASAGVFLKRSLIERVGSFDERLGLGSDEHWSSGEETDYVIRALESGAHIEYEPALVVQHGLAVRRGTALRSRGRREGASVGYLLRKHSYPPRTLARMAIRPMGGIAVSLAHRNTDWAWFHAETLRGRVRGYFGARSAKISA